MCIICFKPAGIDFPSEHLHKWNWTRNPHGAGIAVPTKKGIVYRKGLMSFEEFLEVEKEFKRRFGKDHRFIYHFRIQTGGGIVPHLTHPFPISKNLKEIHQLSGRVNRLFFHNGVIAGYDDPEGKESDTVMFGRYHLYPLLETNPSFLNEENNRTLLGNIAGSRLLVILGEKLFMLGAGWVQQGGYYFSHNCGFYQPLKKETPKQSIFWGGGKKAKKGKGGKGTIKIGKDTEWDNYTPKKITYYGDVNERRFENYGGDYDRLSDRDYYFPEFD